MVKKKWYWITIYNNSHSSYNCVLNLSEAMQKKFRIKVRSSGTGPYGKIELDFAVRSAQKRRDIIKFIKNDLTGVRYRVYWQ